MGENYSSLCENLDLSRLVTNNGRITLTEEGMTKASLFSEGNKFLHDALVSCWTHGIKTYACCSGHEGKEDDPNTNYYPYIGMVLDNNSLPYVRGIIANLQGMKDVMISAGIVHKEENWGPNEPDLYKSFAVSCSLINRCEVFYKIHEAIECQNLDKVALSHSDKNGMSISDFYDKTVEFSKQSLDTLNGYRGISYDNWSRELAQLRWQKTWWQKVKESKMIRGIIEKLFPKEKEKRIATEQYKIGQRDYKPPFFSKSNNAYYNSSSINKGTRITKSTVHNHDISNNDMEI